jgi:transposase-like protein
MGRKRTRRRCSREFKVEAVRLAEERGRSQVEVARELEINPETLYQWTGEFKADLRQSFPRLGNLKESHREVEALRRENERPRRGLSISTKSPRAS